MIKKGYLLLMLHGVVTTICALLSTLAIYSITHEAWLAMGVYLAVIAVGFWNMTQPYWPWWK